MPKMQPEEEEEECTMYVQPTCLRAALVKDFCGKVTKIRGEGNENIILLGNGNHFRFLLLLLQESCIGNPQPSFVWMNQI